MDVTHSKPNTYGRLLDAYRRMFLIRTAEEKIAEFYLKNKVMSFVHFCVGQEAVPAAVSEWLSPSDKVLGNHRSHGHYLAKGGDFKRMMCELLGKAHGSSRGKGGSMHTIDKSVNFVGSTPILGSVVPLASGVAFEQKFNGKNDVTVAFLGDGAFEEGVVYETLNLAGLFRLPLLLVVENNLFAVNSSLAARRAPGHDVGTIVRGFGATYRLADGNNYHDVSGAACDLVAHVRRGNGPAVLECIVYRHMAHSAPIFDESVRVEDTKEARLAADPVRRLRTELQEAGLGEELSQIESAVVREVEEGISFAVSADYPERQTLYTDLYA